jgi:hypothetical protein
MKLSLLCMLCLSNSWSSLIIAATDVYTQVYLQETSYVTPFSLLLWGSNIRHLRHTEDGNGPTIKRYYLVANHMHYHISVMLYYV